MSLERAQIDASQPAGEADVRALAATLKKDIKGKGRAASASAGTAGAGASGAGGESGTAPPIIDDGLVNKNIEVCFAITYRERGKKDIVNNYWCPGIIVRVSDESTVLGRKKLGCGWAHIEYRDGDEDWQLLRPTYHQAKKPGGWRIVAAPTELDTAVPQFEDLSASDESDESDDESGDESGSSEGDDERESEHEGE